MTATRRRGRPGHDLESVLSTSVAAFTEQGFDATSMDDLARRLGVGKSALYHHVESKDALLALALDRALIGLEQLAATVRNSDGPAVERLEILVRGSVRVLVADRPYVTLLLRVHGNSDVERDALVRRRRIDRLGATLVRQAVQDGALHPDVDVAVTARLLFGMVNSMTGGCAARARRTPNAWPTRWSPWRSTACAAVLDRREQQRPAGGSDRGSASWPRLQRLNGAPHPTSTTALPSSICGSPRSCRPRPSRTVSPVQSVEGSGRVMHLLEPVTSANWREGLDVRAGSHQSRFVAGYEPALLVILAKSAVRAGGVEWWPYLIRDGMQVVGVVAVADQRSHDGSLGICHLLIDHQHQRKGYGRLALQRLVRFGQTAERCRTLRLTDNPDNAAAIALYQHERFVVMGTDDDGEIQMALPLRATNQAGLADTSPERLSHVDRQAGWRYRC